MNEKFNIFNLPSKDLSNEPDIIECDGVSKVYNLMGRHDKVIALSEISLSKNSDFYPIKRFITLKTLTQYYIYIYI